MNFISYFRSLSFSSPNPRYRRLHNTAGIILIAVVLTLLTAAPVYAETFIVNSTDDTADATLGDGICATADDVCILRAAIEEANSTIGTADTINFGVTATGPHTIQIAAPLPAITDTVTIDGLTQPDAACATFAAPAALQIEINGTGTTS